MNEIDEIVCWTSMPQTNGITWLLLIMTIEYIGIFILYTHTKDNINLKEKVKRAGMIVPNW